MIPRHVTSMAVHARCRSRKKTDAVTGIGYQGDGVLFAFKLFLFSFLFFFFFSFLLMICTTVEIMQAIRVRELMGRWLVFSYNPSFTFSSFLSYVVMPLCSFTFLDYHDLFCTLPADCCYPRDFHDEQRARLSIAIIHYPLISFVSLEMTFTVRLLPYASFCGLLSRFMTQELMPLDLSQ
ncbi:uncharacterized protein BO96DRAFT_52510 [Aspergillus niger CBS 101883]|uniref:uncharacterized protein n=1 Tax=Aspergillus lacticoffeatus (strain CBS 101883) TaxID=1450533 RepID=UPI000D7F484B|nr:uncharacterized protein BO96DRAFT_52510 [Aspergillus niger CBS 101883]PYH56789.1 hypothetical protein BO96DRAFT_52510 [Aspergillus niger CBS 101883]